MEKNKCRSGEEALIFLLQNLNKTMKDILKTIRDIEISILLCCLALK
jgi:hypothetical protein